MSVLASRDVKARDERVEHLQRLARLELGPGEAEAVSADLELLIGYLERLQAVDVEGEPEWTPPLAPTRALRPDVVAPSLDTSVALGLAPNVQDGFFRVPRTVDDD